MSKTSPVKFMSIASKPQSSMLAEMADDIKEAIYKHSDKIPLAMAIGVLEIVKIEILDDQN
jgi:hypothetical protein